MTRVRFPAGVGLTTWLTASVQPGIKKAVAQGEQRLRTWGTPGGVAGQVTDFRGYIPNRYRGRPGLAVRTLGGGDTLQLQC